MPILFTDAFPDFAMELSSLLRLRGHLELAEQVPSLQVLSRCHCGDYFCGTMYTAVKPKGRWSEPLDTLDLNPKKGMLIVDVVDGKIVCVEALYRPELRERLLELFP